MIAVNDATAAMGTEAACRALGLSRASLYRGRRPATVARPRPTPPRALTVDERQGVLDLLHTRFVDQAPAQMHATLLDEGTYLCSPRTMYRVLDAAHEIKERRDQVRRPHYAAPELLATRPNEVWSWDITKLMGPAKWTYFYLYVILDIFSRYVVGWMLAPRESAALAEHLIGETCAKHGILPGPLTLHADRGGAMRSKPVALLLADLGVTKTHSRPQSRTTTHFQKPSSKRSSTVPSFRSGSDQSRMRGRSDRSFSPGTTRSTATAAWACSRPPSCTSARPPPCGRSGNRCSRPPMPRIRSASSTDRHTQRICRPPCGSTRRRRKRPRRMPQERRSSPRTTLGST
jgi:putative transposase